MSLFLHFSTLLNPLVEGAAVGRHPGVAQPVQLVPRPGRPDAQLAVRDECLAAPGLPHAVLGQEPLLGQTESLLDEVQGDVGGSGEATRGELDSSTLLTSTTSGRRSRTAADTSP